MSLSTAKVLPSTQQRIAPCGARVKPFTAATTKFSRAQQKKLACKAAEEEVAAETAAAAVDDFEFDAP